MNAQIPTTWASLAAKDGAGVDLTAVTVSMDGEPLTDTLSGTAVAVDPGEHTFTFDAAGQARVTKKQGLIQQAQKDRSELVTFGTTPGLLPAARSASPQPASPPSGLGTQKILALVAGGVGSGCPRGRRGVRRHRSLPEERGAGRLPGRQLPDGSGVGQVEHGGLERQRLDDRTDHRSVVGVVAAPEPGLPTAPRKLVDVHAQVGLGPGLVQLRGAW